MRYPSTGTDAVSSTSSEVSQRCITALGIDNGVQSRLQERVVAYTSTPVFPTAIFGTKSVTIGDNVTITSNVPNTPALLGTNGSLTITPASLSISANNATRLYGDANPAFTATITGLKNGDQITATFASADAASAVGTS